MNIFLKLNHILDNFIDFICPKRKQSDPNKLAQVLMIILQYYSGTIGIELKRLIALLVIIEYSHRMQFGVPFMDIDWSENVYNNTNIISEIQYRKEFKFQNRNELDIVVVVKNVYTFNKTINKEQEMLIRRTVGDNFYRPASKIVYKSLSCMNKLIKDADNGFYF